METKIIKVVFGGRRYAVTNKRTRTDYGQMFEFVDINLPETFEVIFSNSDTSAGTGKKMIGSNQRCLIPDEYLKTGQPIYAWVLVHDGEDDGRHMYSIKSPVDDMPDTSPEEPTPVEQSVISQAITALNSAVTTTTQKAQEASESADRAEHAAEGTEGYAERSEAAQTASESARDKATQAETSARTSAATASEKASEAISSATTASQSAITAEQASESASASADASYQNAQTAYRYAQDSATSAGQADESAHTASSKATEASQKASEAAQSALTATQAKTDAETAKQASETAQGLAESARDGAVTAKNDAESARDEAQNLVDGITGKVKQIDSNTERIESLEDDRYKPYVVDSASGSIASFADGADNIPLKSCIVRVEPVQAGSGDPSPDNVRPISGWTGCEVQRTGKNLFSSVLNIAESGIVATFESDGSIYVRGTPTEKVYINIDFNYATARNFKLKPQDDNYKVAASARFVGNIADINSIFFGYVNPAFQDNVPISNNYASKVLTFAKTAERSRTWIKTNANVTYDFHMYVQYEYGENVTEYEKPNTDYISIAFPSEAGTVYGTYVDVTGGEVVVDRAQIASYNGETLPSTWISDRDVYSSGTTPTIGAQVVYELAEPIHYPLTPTEIKTLLGQNNVWSNTGDVSVEYRADVKLYINKKIAEAISALS